MPTVSFSEPIEEGYVYVKRQKKYGLSYGKTRIIRTNNFTFEADETLWRNYVAGDSLTIVVTPALHFVKRVELENNRVRVRTTPGTGRFKYYLLLSLLLLALSVVPLLFKQHTMPRIYAGMAAILLAWLLYMFG